VLTLKTPSLALLPDYVAALRSGWSPNTTRDVCAEQLAAIDADSEAFPRRFLPGATGTVRLADGRDVPRLPGATYWMWDGAFCGAINYRHVPGTEELPAHVSGHVGYAVVPAKRGQGVAKAALRLLLPILRETGLARVLVTCDETNTASRRVIEANGGVFDGVAPDPEHPGVMKLRFWLSVADVRADADTRSAGPSPRA
jgi:predicted acetyltransferase